MAGLAEQDKWARRGIRPAAFELGGFVSFYAALLRAAVARAVRAAPVRDPRGPPRVLEAGGDGAAPLSRLSAAGQGVRGSVGLAAFPFYGFPFFGMCAGPAARLSMQLGADTASACTVVHAREALLRWIHSTGSSTTGRAEAVRRRVDRTLWCAGRLGVWSRDRPSCRCGSVRRRRPPRCALWCTLGRLCCGGFTPSAAR